MAEEESSSLFGFSQCQMPLSVPVKLRKLGILLLRMLPLILFEIQFKTYLYESTRDTESSKQNVVENYFPSKQSDSNLTTVVQLLTHYCYYWTCLTFITAVFLLLLPSQLLVSVVKWFGSILFAIQSYYINMYVRDIMDNRNKRVYFSDTRIQNMDFVDTVQSISFIIKTNKGVYCWFWYIISAVFQVITFLFVRERCDCCADEGKCMDFILFTCCILPIAVTPFIETGNTTVLSFICLTVLIHHIVWVNGIKRAFMKGQNFFWCLGTSFSMITRCKTLGLKEKMKSITLLIFCCCFMICSFCAVKKEMLKRRMTHVMKILSVYIAIKTALLLLYAILTGLDTSPLNFICNSPVSLLAVSGVYGLIHSSVQKRILFDTPRQKYVEVLRVSGLVFISGAWKQVWTLNFPAQITWFTVLLLIICIYELTCLDEAVGVVPFERAYITESQITIYESQFKRFANEVEQFSLYNCFATLIIFIISLTLFQYNVETHLTFGLLVMSISTLTKSINLYMIPLTKSGPLIKKLPANDAKRLFGHIDASSIDLQLPVLLILACIYYRQFDTVCFHLFYIRKIMTIIRMKLFLYQRYLRESGVINILHRPRDPPSPEDLCILCNYEFRETEFDEIRETACKHVFHSDCLSLWTISSLSCPVCMHSLFKNKAGEFNVVSIYSELVEYLDCHLLQAFSNLAVPAQNMALQLMKADLNKLTDHFEELETLNESNCSTIPAPDVTTVEMKSMSEYELHLKESENAFSDSDILEYSDETQIENNNSSTYNGISQEDDIHTMANVGVGVLYSVDSPFICSLSEIFDISSPSSYSMTSVADGSQETLSLPRAESLITHIVEKTVSYCSQ